MLILVSNTIREMQEWTCWNIDSKFFYSTASNKDRNILIDEHRSNGWYYPRTNILSQTAYLYPSQRVKYLISSPSNLNFGLISPWLEKILNLVPLKCLEMPPNRPDM